jgi:hypothetical protein
VMAPNDPDGFILAHGVGSGGEGGVSDHIAQCVPSLRSMYFRSGGHFQL